MLTLFCRVIFAFYVAVAFFPDVQFWYMQKFHPGRALFGVWAPMRLVPSMYSFENRLNVKSTRENVTVSRNHDPLHPLFFRLDRGALRSSGPCDIELISGYRNVVCRTRYELRWTGRVHRLTILPDDAHGG